MYEHDEIDYIISDDSDFIAMSIFNLIRGVQMDGSCMSFSSSKTGGKEGQ